MTAADKKDQVIGNLLGANGTYLPESGLYKKVETALKRLSYDDLSSLKLLVDLTHDRIITTFVEAEKKHYAEAQKQQEAIL